MLSELMLGLGLFTASVLSTAAEEAKFSPGMVSSGYHDSPSWFKESFLDLREDVEEARQASRRVMLYFYQDGSPGNATGPFRRADRVASFPCSPSCYVSLRSCRPVPIR